jgi:hypothetical protein
MRKESARFLDRFGFEVGLANRLGVPSIKVSRWPIYETLILFRIVLKLSGIEKTGDETRSNDSGCRCKLNKLHDQFGKEKIPSRRLQSTYQSTLHNGRHNATPFATYSCGRNLMSSGLAAFLSSRIGTRYPNESERPASHELANKRWFGNGQCTRHEASSSVWDGTATRSIVLKSTIKSTIEHELIIIPPRPLSRTDSRSIPL